MTDMLIIMLSVHIISFIPELCVLEARSCEKSMRKAPLKITQLGIAKVWMKQLVTLVYMGGSRLVFPEPVTW